MTRFTILGGAFAALLILLVGSVAFFALDTGGDLTDRSPATSFPASTVAVAAEPEPHQDFLYGRVTTLDDATYEGRLRWGREEEAFWGDYFNGRKSENIWANQIPTDQIPKESVGIAIFGIGVTRRERDVDLGRFFMQRFGDIARIESDGGIVRVLLKNQAVFELDRFEAGDFDDGVRVWDNEAGVVDLGPRQIRSIVFLPTPPLAVAAYRLHGTVRSRHGEFSGFVQWNRESCVGSDTLDGTADVGALSLRFDTIGSIARDSRDRSFVTLLDGRQIVLSGSRAVGEGNRGVYVDDPRFGRVLISWDAFERVEFSAAGNAPAYDDFPPGQSLSGRVSTRDGRRLAGRLVFDLDESETTETFDAPSGGVDYTIPFGLIAAIDPPARERARDGRVGVTFHDGRTLQLEQAGDLGEANAGMLIFVEGGERPEYVPWDEVECVEFDRPPAMFPPLDGV